MEDAMNISSDEVLSPTVRDASFPSTHWSVLATLGKSDANLAKAALEQLCASYWYPIYAFIRRQGADSHGAKDLTQSFFSHLLEKQSLLRADQTKGKFRTFLLASLHNFLNNERDRKQTLKRGGHLQFVSLDETVGEELYRHEMIEAATAENLFERRWALTIVRGVLSQLQQEYVTSGKMEVFVKLEPFLTGETTQGVYNELSMSLNMKEGAARVALHRMRRRFGDLLRNEIARTVMSPEEIDDEIRFLFAAIG